MTWKTLEAEYSKQEIAAGNLIVKINTCLGNVEEIPNFLKKLTEETSNLLDKIWMEEPDTLKKMIENTKEELNKPLADPDKKSLQELYDLLCASEQTAISYQNTELISNPSQKETQISYNNKGKWGWEIEKAKNFIQQTLASLQEITKEGVSSDSEFDVQQVINLLENPTQENIQNLQKFIYENLTDNDKKLFLTSSFSQRDINKPDGKFWENTREQLEKIISSFKTRKIKQIETEQHKENRKKLVEENEQRIATEAMGETMEIERSKLQEKQKEKQKQKEAADKQNREMIETARKNQNVVNAFSQEDYNKQKAAINQNTQEINTLTTEVNNEEKHLMTMYGKGTNNLENFSKMTVNYKKLQEKEGEKSKLQEKLKNSLYYDTEKESYTYLWKEKKVAEIDLTKDPEALLKRQLTILKEEMTEKNGKKYLLENDNIKVEIKGNTATVTNLKSEKKDFREYTLEGENRKKVKTKNANEEIKNNEQRTVEKLKNYNMKPTVSPEKQKEKDRDLKPSDVIRALNGELREQNGEFSKIFNISSRYNISKHGKDEIHIRLKDTEGNRGYNEKDFLNAIETMLGEAGIKTIQMENYEFKSKYDEELGQKIVTRLDFEVKGTIYDENAQSSK